VTPYQLIIVNRRVYFFHIRPPRVSWQSQELALILTVHKLAKGKKRRRERTTNTTKYKLE